MKTILRNFISVLRRFKTASVLNVLGLSIAFVAFMLIMMQVNYDYTFDCSHRNADAIFRVDIVHGSKGSQAIICRPFARAFTESSPHIKGGCLLSAWVGSPFFYVEQNGQRTGYRENAWEVTPGLLDVIHFDMLEGTAQALDEPGSVILPESMAKKIFGNESAVGKQLIVPDTEMNAQIVKGVYKDFPRNSVLQNVMYAAMNPKENYDNWGNWNYFFFVRLDDPVNKENVLDNFRNNFNAKEVFGNEFEWGEENSFDLRLTSLPDVHFLNNVDFDSMPKASRQTLLVLFSIAFVIIIIAGINFTNFSTALTPMRIKSINTQKVLGSSTASLRISLMIEAIAICLFSCLLSFLLTWMLNRSGVLTFVEADTNMLHYIPLLFMMLGMAVLLGVIAGLYPAWYMTSFQPALVLKGSFGLSVSGRKLRMVLIGFQYVVSIGLIIGSFFIQLQNNYMRSYKLGFDKDQVAMAVLSTEMVEKSGDLLMNRLKEHVAIEDVGFASDKVGASNNYSANNFVCNDKEFNTEIVYTSWNFLDVVGIPIISGHNFNRSDAESDSTYTCIFTRRVQELAPDMEPGHLLKKSWMGIGRVAGFVDNIKISSLRSITRPLVFIVTKKQVTPVCYIRLAAGADVEDAVAHIHRVIADIDPAYPFEVEFYDTVFNNLYHKEQYLKKMVTLFSLLAIVLSIVGVFGLVVFETQYRRKEIGVRKVFGATVGEVLNMFNRSYLRIVSICFVIAVPFAYYGVYKWLENFSDRTPIYWWVFVLAFGIVAGITMLTVTFQNWKAANENPVNSVKSE